MTATPVSKEEVRLLAIEYGVREAARKLGLNEDRVRQWSSRHKWFSKPDVQKAIVTTVTKPADIVLDELANNERETRIGLAKHAKHAIAAINKSVHPAKWTKEAKEIAQTAGIVHKWSDQGTGQSFTLNVLNMGAFGVTVGDQDTEA